MPKTRSLPITCLFFVFLCLAFVVSCADPTKLEIEKAKHFDFERTKGKIISISIKYYQGDREHTKDKIGQPYYCMTIQYDETNTTEELEGVDADIFDIVDAGTGLPLPLPLTLVLTAEQLAEMEGVIIDAQANLAANKWHIVVKNKAGIKRDRVSKETFYEFIDINIRLPISLE